MNFQCCRSQFPALQIDQGNGPAIFLDGPAGTQVPQQTIDAIAFYLAKCNANHGGVFATSVESDDVLNQAHSGMAAFLNAKSPEEIIFGPNMTTLTFQISRALSKTWKPGDEVVVTKLDHDANFSPWVLAARDVGAQVKVVDFHPEDCTLDMEDLQIQISEKTKLVAVTAASNVVGSITDIPKIARLAHKAGALIYVDAVHFAPHSSVDVQAWECDFLVCSAYKFFGPHLGILWGKNHLLEELPAYKVRPAPNSIPGKWMTGTQNHECISGLTGTLRYLAGLGDNLPSHKIDLRNRLFLRQQFLSAFSAIEVYENFLVQGLLSGLAQLPSLRVWGITTSEVHARRVPTIALTHRSMTAEQMAIHLANNQIYSWHGNMYAQNLTERLNLEKTGGVLRLGLVHYNTMAEIDRVLKVFHEIC